MRDRRRTSCTAAAAAALLLVSAARAEDDVPMRAAKDELARSMSALQLQGMDRPYFIAYRVEDVDGETISAVLGSLTAAVPQRARSLSVELRVGDYALDNGNFMSTRSFGGTALSSRTGGPLDDSYDEIRRQLWLATDAQYKSALETLSAKRAALRARKRADDLPDLSRVEPHVESGPVERTGARRAELEALARDLSAVFRSRPAIHRSLVKLEVRDVTTRYANSEGSAFTRAVPSVRLRVEAEARTVDGMPVSDAIEVSVRRAADLPLRDALVARTRELADRVLRLREAPVPERYVGPVLFEGEAAAEIFGQSFANGLVAIRQPVSDDPRFDMFYGQLTAQLGGGSLLDKLGARVLPEFLGVVDAPLAREHRGVPLVGGQAVDDDGVPTRETRLVERGVLKTLLTTRVPVRTLRATTGSRRGAGPAPSNLLVSNDRPVSDAELRRELLRRAKARGLDHGIVVRRVGGGGAASLARLAARFGGAGTVGSNAMAEVVRVWADGREEVLRGVELTEVPVAAFRDVVAAGDAPAVHTDDFVNGLFAMLTMGPPAIEEVPAVSCVVPSLLFEELALTPSRGPFPSALVAASPLARAP